MSILRRYINAHQQGEKVRKMSARQLMSPERFSAAKQCNVRRVSAGFRRPGGGRDGEAASWCAPGSRRAQARHAKCSIAPALSDARACSPAPRIRALSIAPPLGHAPVARPGRFSRAMPRSWHCERGPATTGTVPTANTIDNQCSRMAGDARARPRLKVTSSR